jgi:hypothetical protein
MERIRLMLSVLALVLAACFALSCGASSHGQGQLQSITLSPATGEGEEQFVATGYYIHPSYTETPQPATWGACYQGAPTSEVSVTSGGVAQCASGATGTYTVFAYDVSNPACETAINACGDGGCSAQLTCP